MVFIPKLPENIWKTRIENEVKELKDSKIDFTRLDSLTFQFNFNKNVMVYSGNSDNAQYRNANRLSFQVVITRDYPYPGSISVKALNPVFHPNIHPVTGFVCTAIMKKWVPTNTLQSLYLALDSLIDNPNPDDPLNLDAAEYWKKNKL